MELISGENGGQIAIILKVSIIIEINVGKEKIKIVLEEKVLWG